MSLEAVQLSQYFRPEVKETMTKEYVLNGDKHSFYKYLIDRYNGSPTNRAIIDSYAQFIYGKGLTSTQKNSKPVQFAMIMQILSKTNLRNICFDKYCLGEGGLELIYEKGKLKQILHVAKNLLAPSKMNEDGDIESYWYSLDFTNIRKNPPVEIPVFNTKDKKNGSYIYVIKDYQIGRTYYSDPSYLSALPYAELEEEIANYCINHIKNGLSFGHIWNMNNGDPESDEVKDKILKKIQGGKGSSNANRTFVNWSEKESGITVESLEVTDAHKQYEFLSGESTQKLMIGHRVTSPILFGIKDSSGLGNNANEMESAFNELMINVIQPKQETILDALMEIFTDAGMTIDLDFIPLRTVSQGEPEATKLSVENKESDPIIATQLIELGEVIDEGWELIDEEKYSDESVHLSELSLRLAIVPANVPLGPDPLDNEYFKVRFEYAGSLKPEREFCRKMISAGRVFRLQDINAASKNSVNPGWGPEGADNYDILKYKGGGNCHHYWLRKVYLKKGNNYITVADAKRLVSDLKKKGIDTKIPESPEPLSTVKPYTMPNEGFLKSRK